MNENNDSDNPSGSSSSDDSSECDSDCHVDSMNAPQIESLESVDPNYSDSDEDTLPDCFGTDVKLKPLQIMKIDIDRFWDNTTSKSDNLQQVKSMINTMVRKRPLSVDDVNEPPKKKRRLANANKKFPSSAEVERHNLENVYRKELRLKPKIEREFTDAGIPFHLKCFLLQKQGNTALTKTIINLVAQQSKEILRRKEQIVNSYLIFFYRNIQYRNKRSRKVFFKPEVFVLSVGFARTLVLKFAEKSFTEKVERRILQFPFHKVEYRKESGPVYKRTDVARPGQSILFDVWDFLDKIVGNRKRQLRDNSSLYSEGLNAFCSDTGESLPIKVDVKEKSLKINRSLTLAQMGSTLTHFSKISLGQQTFEYNTSLSGRKEELDTPEFEMHDFHSKVTNRRLRKDLNERLYKIMERSMTGHENTFIYLTHKDIAWTNAEKIFLYAHKLNNERRSKVKEWFNPPSLDEVLGCLNKTCEPGTFDPEWLNDVQLKFNGKSKPLKDFIFTRIDFRKVGSYIYYFGTWLKTTTHYLSLIEKDFTKLLSENLMDADEIPLLPWKVVQGDKSGVRNGTRQYKIPPFDFQDTKRWWRRHFQAYACNNHESFEDLEKVMFKRKLVRLNNTEKTDTDLIIKETIIEHSVCTVATRLYVLHEGRLTEEDYNASHALFNILLSHKTGNKITMITCDRKEPHGIEICDILVWEGNTTYLVHVKSGFTGSAIREVCSQIRNSADHIYREQISTKGTGMVDAFWETLTSDTQKGYHKVAAREILQNMGYGKFKELFHSKRDIVFVLACRDDRKSDFKEDTVRRNFMVNMEEEITDNLPIDDPEEVITKLMEEMYLTENGNLTNKFILDGKDNKTKFIKSVKQWDEIGNQKNADTLFDILVSGLSKSKSTIAKMEIIRLCQDFKKYCVGKKQFQLKITSIDKQYRKHYKTINGD